MKTLLAIFTLNGAFYIPPAVIIVLVILVAGLAAMGLLFGVWYWMAQSTERLIKLATNQKD